MSKVFLLARFNVAVQSRFFGPRPRRKRDLSLDLDRDPTWPYRPARSPFLRGQGRPPTRRSSAPHFNPDRPWRNQSPRNRSRKARVVFSEGDNNCLSLIQDEDGHPVLRLERLDKAEPRCEAGTRRLLPPDHRSGPFNFCHLCRQLWHYVSLGTGSARVHGFGGWGGGGGGLLPTATRWAWGRRVSPLPVPGLTPSPSRSATQHSRNLDRWRLPCSPWPAQHPAYSRVCFQGPVRGRMVSLPRCHSFPLFQSVVAQERVGAKKVELTLFRATGAGFPSLHAALRLCTRASWSSPTFSRARSAQSTAARPRG